MTRLNRKSSRCVALPLLVVMLAACGARIDTAFVDVQRALNEVRDGKMAKSKLMALFNDRQRDLDDRQKQLKMVESQLHALKGTVSEEEFARHFEFYRKSFTEIQGAYLEHQRDLNIMEQAATKVVIEQMKSILTEMATARKLRLIVEVNEGGAFYYDKSRDVTDELIRIYDERHRSGEAVLRAIEEANTMDDATDVSPPLFRFNQLN